MSRSSAVKVVEKMADALANVLLCSLLVTFRSSSEGRAGTLYSSDSTANHFFSSSWHTSVQAVMMQSKTNSCDALKETRVVCAARVCARVPLKFCLFGFLFLTYTCLIIRRSQDAACRQEYDVGGVSTRRCFTDTGRMELADGFYFWGAREAEGRCRTAVRCIMVRGGRSILRYPYCRENRIWKPPRPGGFLGSISSLR